MARTQLVGDGAITDTVADNGLLVTGMDGFAVGDLAVRLGGVPADVLIAGGGGMPPFAAVSASFSFAFNVFMQL